MSGSTVLLPIKYHELLNISSYDIGKGSINFKNVTLQSEKYVCIREEKYVSIINIETKEINKLSVIVDSAIMNPKNNIIALRAKTNMQIYDLESKVKLKSVTADDKIEFWKWLDSHVIAYITNNSVYHWDINGESDPVKIFDRGKQTFSTQILNYITSSDKQWISLCEIYANEDRRIEGTLSLFSVFRKISQPIMNAHAGCFANMKLDNSNKTSDLFCFVNKTVNGSKLSVVEVGVEKSIAFKSVSNIQFSNESDFPVFIIPDNKHNIIYLFTKFGYIYLYDIQFGKCILAKRISQSTIFQCTSHSVSNGAISLDQDGRIILFSINEENIIPYISKTLNDTELSIKMSNRFSSKSLPSESIEELFDKYLNTSQYSDAAMLAANSPNNILRTKSTIERFKELPHISGEPAPILQYFSALLKKGVLNKHESIELAKPIINAKTVAGRNYIEGWLKKGKLYFSEELGDILRPHEMKLACSIYIKSNCPEKVINCFVQLGEHSKIVEYAKSVSYKPDYNKLLSDLYRVNKETAKDFAVDLCDEKNNLINIAKAVEIFMGNRDVETTTSFLLDVLIKRGNREEDAELQTILLTINLKNDPSVAEAILQSDEYQLSYFDKPLVGSLCEKAGLYQRAIEIYDNIIDIKRCLQQGLSLEKLKKEFVISFFGEMTPKEGLDCLEDLMKYNLKSNLRLVVDIAKEYSQQMSPDSLIKLFEKYNSYSGLYYYLNHIINTCEKPEIIVKYIKAATELEQFRELERVCKENKFYEPNEVKKFLIESDLKNPRPLIYVCDRFGFAEELTKYLYYKKMFPFIEAYTKKMNTLSTPKVVGALIDVNANEESIKSLFMHLRPPKISIKELVFEVKKRDKLRLLMQWLEMLSQEGSTDVYLHNAIGKIYVAINNNPTQFLTNNAYYDSRELGKYCESINPRLSFVSYKRAGGECDDELIELTNKNKFFKEQARYLVERQDEALWQKVLCEENINRPELINQVVATALVESRVPEEVSVTVKAFMAADLPNELIELLEKIVLHGSPDREFHNNKNLQNLLIITAIKVDPKRVMEYLTALNNYDGPDIAKIAVSDSYKLYKEAFFIYKKFKKYENAVNILIHNMDALDRAKEFAKELNQPEIWSLVGNALLNDGQIEEAINCLLSGDNFKNYEEVISVTSNANKWEELIKYLKKASTKINDLAIKTEIIFAFAKINNLDELEEYIKVTNISKLEDVGYRCLNEDLYEAGKIIFDQTGNYAQLAICFVNLEMYEQAVNAANKADNIPTWKAVCYACVDADEFKLAQSCSLHIIIYMEHLKDLENHYEIGGNFDKIIAVLESGITLERAHIGIFTELGILYAKYQSNKLMKHITKFHRKMNLTSLIDVCKQCGHWVAVSTLYHYNNQSDYAIDIIIEHSSICWEKDFFEEVIIKVSNSEVLYRSINFYIRERPLLLDNLLIKISKKLDPLRVIKELKQQNYLPLIHKYLLYIQKINNPIINECINEFYIEELNFDKLRKSIELYNEFDQVKMALKLEKSPLIEFRKISALLFQKNKRFDKSINISKEDNMYKEAISYASESKNKLICQDLLKFFVKEKKKDCFVACLLVCFDYLSTDFVLEVAWHNECLDIIMPYVIQVMGNYEKRLSKLEEMIKKSNKKTEEMDEEKMKHAAGLLEPNDILSITDSSYLRNNESSNNSSEVNANDIGRDIGYKW